MARDVGVTLTHLYGFGSLVAGLASIYFSIKPSSSWAQYALVASGWLSALMFAGILLKVQSEAREDVHQIGRLEAELANLQRELTTQRQSFEQDLEAQRQGLEQELARRTMTTDFLAGLLTGRHAKPRGKAQAIAAAETEDGDVDD